MPIKSRHRKKHIHKPWTNKAIIDLTKRKKEPWNTYRINRNENTNNTENLSVKLFQSVENEKQPLSRQ